MRAAPRFYRRFGPDRIMSHQAKNSEKSSLARENPLKMQILKIHLRIFR